MTSSPYSIACANGRYERKLSSSVKVFTRTFFSTGIMTLLWVSLTPLESPVVPEVKLNM